MIIGLCGFAGAGKGTVADVLVSEFGFRKVSFADGVKDATAAIFGWPRNLLEGDTEESRIFREMPDEWWSEKFGYEVTPRAMLQKMGTEAGRNVFHPDLWVIAAARRNIGHDIVIPDVRFPNEMKWIKESGGEVIRVVRGDEPEWYDTAVCVNRYPTLYTPSLMEQNYPDVHYSEWAWIGSPDIGATIGNNGMVSDLREITRSHAIYDLNLTPKRQPAIMHHQV